VGSFELPYISDINASLRPQRGILFLTLSIAFPHKTLTFAPLKRGSLLNDQPKEYPG